jgi:hypothetical protein
MIDLKDILSEVPPVRPNFVVSSSDAPHQAAKFGGPVADPTTSRNIHHLDRRVTTCSSQGDRRRALSLITTMNWLEGPKKDPENNSSRIWGRLVEATSTARQKVADKYYDMRDGGHGTAPHSPPSVTYLVH